MSDEINSPEDGADKNAHRQSLNDLFDDLDDGDMPEDTIESLREERDDLAEKVSAYHDLLDSVRADNRELIKSVQDVKDDLQKVKKKLEQDRRETIGKFIGDLQPVFGVLQENLNGLEAEKAADAKLAKLAEGFDKTIAQISAVFNKYAPRAALPETPADELQNEPAANNSETPAAEKPEDTLQSLSAECRALEEKMITLGNTLSRAQSDQQTLTRRLSEAKSFLQRDIAKLEEEQKFGLEKCVKDMLPVLDTLDLGLQAIRKDKSGDAKIKSLGNKVDTTLGNLKAVFNIYGISEINPINEAFDENKHEVITVQPRPGVDPETVVLVHQKGYEIEGRLIRPAKVIVTPPD